LLGPHTAQLVLEALVIVGDDQSVSNDYIGPLRIQLSSLEAVEKAGL